MPQILAPHRRARILAIHTLTAHIPLCSWILAVARGCLCACCAIKPTLLSSFEVFEHLPNPMEQISAMLTLCPNLLFSTELLPCPIPPHQGKEAWWYYGFAHGQHISFYARETLEYIARQQGVFLVSHNGLHLFSQRKISPFVFATLVRLAHRGAFWILKRLLGSKTLSDHQLLSPSSRPAPN